jgi:hypothetical protein
VKTLALWALAAGAAFVAFGFYVNTTPAGKARMAARHAVETCWSEYERKSNTPSQQRSIATVCEQMERARR